jgi:hypothetical protein
VPDNVILKAGLPGDMSKEPIIAMKVSGKKIFKVEDETLI